ncbi:radical SAM protein [uncultured Clostridium sp.]|uniref:radical SAM protein n=1 Tax=uncultured Clostridium sp. TaxID=59620 RepID=UPI0025E604EE|nr:radical SAM protein [uncultured Clostridium sp.]
MIWNKKLRTIENNRFIALFNGSSTLKVLKNDFDIINKILENNVQLRDIEECFERKEDASIMISGGEPLVRKDFMKIIEYLNQRINCHKTLMTNGLLINDTNIDFIIKNFDELSISLDGCDKELTEIVRGVDIFDTILDKVKKLHKKEYYNISL